MLLLVVDMQKGLFETPRYEASKVIRRINHLVAKIRKIKGNIIFIQHDGPKGDLLEPLTPGWALINSLDRQDTDLVIRKKSCDAFVDTPLLKTLIKLNTNRVIITGCATDFCVDTTIRSAAAKGFEVIVARDAHTTADRPHLDARTIITHHNWSWENLILLQGRIRVADTHTLIEEI
ncbi:MAG: isochorismatase family protein [Desulfobacter sp.]|nr:MAG: isochorismatase family protein [Desulfobacter sp.]